MGQGVTLWDRGLLGYIMEPPWWNNEALWLVSGELWFKKKDQRTTVDKCALWQKSGVLWGQRGIVVWQANTVMLMEWPLWNRVCCDWSIEHWERTGDHCDGIGDHLDMTGDQHGIVGHCNETKELCDGLLDHCDGAVEYCEGTGDHC